MPSSRVDVEQYSNSDSMCQYGFIGCLRREVGTVEHEKHVIDVRLKLILVLHILAGGKMRESL